MFGHMPEAIIFFVGNAVPSVPCANLQSGMLRNVERRAKGASVALRRDVPYKDVKVKAFRRVARRFVCENTQENP